MLNFVRQLFGFVRRKNPPRAAGAERRKAPRVQTPIHMDVCFLEGPHEEFGDGRVQDISASGLHFISESKPANDARMVLKIHFPTTFKPRNPIQVKGKVVRRSKIKGEKRYRVACSFSRVDHASHKRLEDFIHWISSKASHKK